MRAGESGEDFPATARQQVVGQIRAELLRGLGVSAAFTAHDLAPVRRADHGGHRQLRAMQLRVGDVLELPKETLSQAQIRVATKPRFLASVGIEDSRVVAQIHSGKAKINS